MKLTPHLWNWDGTVPGEAWLDALAKDSPVVWQAWLPRDESALSRLIPLLSLEERARMERFRLREDQQRFLVGRGLLRMLIGFYWRIPAERVELKYNSFGKPYAVSDAGASPLHFNVSHSGKLVLLVFSRTHEVGVDVEEIREDVDWEGIARRVFRPEEYGELAQLKSPERSLAFFRAWARHEAGLKARGQGFSAEQNPDSTARLLYYDVVLPNGYQGAVASALD